MSIYDHVITYSQDEVHRASLSLDEMMEKRRKVMYRKFILGFTLFSIWSIFWAYVMYGWIG